MGRNEDVARMLYESCEGLVLRIYCLLYCYRPV